MNYKKIAMGIMTLSFVLIISGGVSSFVLGLQKDKEEIYNRIIEVNNEFEVFSTNTTVFENFRNELYNVVLSNVYYPDGKVNTKCSNYKLIYEQVVNYFVSDINVYNENVKKYNEYQKNNNSDLRVDKYKTSKVYIDYNNDNEYDGKE